jgi:hypothetical protein
LCIVRGQGEHDTNTIEIHDSTIAGEKAGAMETKGSRRTRRTRKTKKYDQTSPQEGAFLYQLSHRSGDRGVSFKFIGNIT